MHNLVECSDHVFWVPPQLAGILLDTKNLSKMCSNRDSEAVQLLLFGTSEHMRHELFQQCNIVVFFIHTIFIYEYRIKKQQKYVVISIRNLLLLFSCSVLLDHNDHSFVEYLKNNYREPSTKGELLFILYLNRF